MYSKLNVVVFLSGAALLIGGFAELQAARPGGFGGGVRGGGIRPAGFQPAAYRSPMPRTPSTYNPGITRPISRPVVNNRPVNILPVNNLPVNNLNRGINPYRPPGWDWWRIYPWSPYNAWRNPYWFPPYNWYYPYSLFDVNPYPGVLPYGYGYGNTVNPAAYYGAQVNVAPQAQANAQLEAPLPRPTGELKTPPANGVILQLRGLDQFTPVQFNGQEVASVGTTRYYVMELTPGKNYSYSIAAVADRNGQTRTEERRINLTAGDVVMIDFGSPVATVGRN